MNNIIPFYDTEQAQTAEKENTFNAIKYRMAVSYIQRLLNGKEITPDEFERGRNYLARRFRQTVHEVE